MSERLPFSKMQGVGNDFVVVDGRTSGYRDWSALAPELCDRNTGIGADGLLVLDNTQLADIMMRMYNPDGTPDVCGNGLRCVARFAIERGIVPGDSLRIATLAGVRQAQAWRDSKGAITAITVGMGIPRFDPPSIPMRVPLAQVQNYPLDLEYGRTLIISALSTGSTHAVTFVSELPDDNTFFTVSRQVEHSPLFPERTSLMWCQVEAPDRLGLRIWERGAGETWGCGTGACAAAVAAMQQGLVPTGEPVAVASRGGELQIVWREGEPIRMTGPAVSVYEGLYALETSSGE